MFVFCGLITEAYYVHCLGGVDWLGGVHEEQGRQPAGGLVQHCGCTEWLCQLEPVTAGGARELPQFKLQVSLVQKFKIQFWVMTLKNWTQCTLHLSMRVVVQRDFSIYSPNRLDAWVEEVSTHCEGCFVWGPDADLPQGWGAQCGVEPLCRLKLFLNAKPISHEKKGELLLMDCFVSYFKDYFICRNLDQESDDSADFWYLNLQATCW